VGDRKARLATERQCFDTAPLEPLCWHDIKLQNFLKGGVSGSSRQLYKYKGKVPKGSKEEGTLWRFLDSGEKELVDTLPAPQIYSGRVRSQLVGQNS